MSAARLGQTDRAFATFQEYKPLFRVEPSVHSYNALIQAAALSYKPSVAKILSIFQEMEKFGLSPNSFSFSMLLEVNLSLFLLAHKIFINIPNIFFLPDNG
jgi:pentatricopeptide repeat protein